MNDMRENSPRPARPSIKIHELEDFDGMRRAGRLAAETLDFITQRVKAGVSTGELDVLCETFIRDHGAIPAPLGYRGFPKSICTSINEVVCHGIPDNGRILQESDILNIDVTVILDGWHGDTSRMYAVGVPPPEAQKLINVTFDAMWRGIATVKPKAKLGDIGYAIQHYVQKRQYSVVRDFCGHGLGRVFHDAPNVLHFGKRGRGEALREGMFFTIEPMVNLGGFEVDVLPDGWTAVTRDGKLSAQFEHSIGVTADGFEVFTLSPAGLDRPDFPVE